MTFDHLTSKWCIRVTVAVENLYTPNVHEYIGESFFVAELHANILMSSIVNQITCCVILAPK